MLSFVAPAATMPLMSVTVPDGLFPGDTMTVAVGAQEYNITVPDGVMGGDPLEVDLPAEEGGDEPPPDEQGATTTVSIVVPDGCYEGTEFTVEFDGREFNIAVPDGVFPGESIEVELPRAAPA